MKVKEAMNPGVITVSPFTKPLEAFEKMYKNGVRRLFVLDENEKPIGVVSYTDLIGTLGSLKPRTSDIEDIRVVDIMIEDLIIISADDRIEDAANLMLRADISGLLVLEYEKPVGVITKTDICRLVAAGILIPV
ncbi:MAG: CBS domain-containing protein [Euryarchaeota archaeon]|nr:CBS domain-containing protein [Euryarchaeota archaeon]